MALLTITTENNFRQNSARRFGAGGKLRMRINTALRMSPFIVKRASISRMRWSRYADVYNRLYDASDRDSFGEVVGGMLRQFKQHPCIYTRLPYLIHKLITTQSIGSRASSIAGTNLDTIRWSLRLADFVRERAARNITRRALDFLWRVGGPMYRKQLCALQEVGMVSLSN